MQEWIEIAAAPSGRTLHRKGDLFAFCEPWEAPDDASTALYGAPHAAAREHVVAAWRDFFEGRSDD